jgi:hypothetical protein
MNIRTRSDEQRRVNLLLRQQLQKVFDSSKMVVPKLVSSIFGLFGDQEFRRYLAVTCFAIHVSTCNQYRD